MDKNQNLRVAGGSAILLEEDIGHRVVFDSHSMESGFAGRLKKHDVVYVITFMPDELGVNSTYDAEFFDKIREHGFELCRQEIDWIGKEAVHYIRMEFRREGK